jgi:hypothetical protein
VLVCVAYFSDFFSLCAVFWNMIWQYVNSTNCMMFVEVGVRGGGGYMWGRLVRIVCPV